MADLRDNYGTRGRQTDEVHTATDVDEYGNPIYPSGTTGGYGGVTGTGGVTRTHGNVTDVGIGAGGHEQLRRSGSSSSSEEDEHGVRRKKGLKGKITEKLPGGHKDKDDTGYGYGTGQEHEKKGMMEKIKEKLPGGGHKDERQTTHTAGYGGTQGAGYGGTQGAGYGGTQGTGYGETQGTDYGGTQGTGHEKKGMMEKIKDKLPGTHKD